MAAAQLRMGELVATLALAQDNAFGQPLESQFRSCILASWLCEDAGFDADVRTAVYWVALLRYVGCTGHAHEVSALFGDEIALRARTLVHDAADPHEVVGDLLDFAASDPARAQHLPTVQAVMAIGRGAFIPNFAAGCEVGDALVQRLDLPAGVRTALRCTFERWNGNGFPNGVSGTDIPLAMRVVHLTHDMEAVSRVRSPADALRAAADRRDRTYDPALADLFVEHGERWLRRLDAADPWPTVLQLEPAPHRTLGGAALDDALTVVADFVDLKSPFMAGHSRRCAELVQRAGVVLGLDRDSITVLRCAALVHDLGTTAVPNSIWDKNAALTSAELDRVRLHSVLTEQMLRRTPAFAAITPVAAAHHEKADGSGYHKGLRAGMIGVAAGLLGAVDVYVGLTADRADRTAFAADLAAAELRQLGSAGVLDGPAVEAVLTATGHTGERRKVSTTTPPGGLTGREADVLRLAAQGLTTKAIAERLYISAKTADHHIQHVYTKIGVSSRGAAALWAMQHGLIT